MRMKRPRDLIVNTATENATLEIGPLQLFRADFRIYFFRLGVKFSVLRRLPIPAVGLYDTNELARFVAGIHACRREAFASMSKRGPLNPLRVALERVALPDQSD